MSVEARGTRVIRVVPKRNSLAERAIR